MLPACEVSCVVACVQKWMPFLGTLSTVKAVILLSKGHCSLRTQYQPTIFCHQSIAFLQPASDVGYAYRGQHSPSSGTVTSVMTPLLEKTDHVLASWGFSRGNTMQSKHAEGASTSQTEASGRTGDPDVDASNSLTSVVTPLLEKTDDYLATWGLTTSASNPKSEDGTPVQVSCATLCVRACVCVRETCHSSQLPTLLHCRAAHPRQSKPAHPLRFRSAPSVLPRRLQSPHRMEQRSKTL